MRFRWRLLAPAAAVLLLAAVSLPAGATHLAQKFENMKRRSHSKTGLINSDLAFWGDRAYAGNYGGFRIFDISNPKNPRLLSDFDCFGPQNDVSVYDTTGDGEADVLFTSVDSVLTGPECGSGAAEDIRDPDGWEGIRIFDVSDPANPSQIGAVYQHCGSHTHTLVPDPDNERLLIYNQSYSLRAGPTCGLPAEGEPPHHNRDPVHGVIQVIEVPFADPAAAATIAEPEINYPGDSDNLFVPAHHGLPGFDPLRACHDSAVMLGATHPDSQPGDMGLAAGACAEQAQLWRIDADGLPVTDDPLWVFDNVSDDDGVEGPDTAADFWHSATFTWDGQVVNFSDESFGDGCPTVTEITDPDASTHGPSDTGRTYFLDVATGTPFDENGFFISRVPEPKAYCSTHQGNVVATDDGYFLVQAWYMGGVDVIDFTDPANPEEIAYFDIGADGARGSDNWSHYWYQGPGIADNSIVTYGQDGVHNPRTGRGFQVFEVFHDLDTVTLGHLNPQTQEAVLFP